MQAELDKICKELAAKHNTSEKLVNLFIQTNLIIAKLGVIAVFATSKHIDVKESIGTLNTEVTNLAIVGGALANIEDAALLMSLYSDVNARITPLLTTYYTPAANRAEKGS